MNIKNRITRLENKPGAENRFCACFHDYYATQIDAVYDNTPFTELPLPEGDFCEKCRKPVNRIDKQTVSTINQLYSEVETT